MKRFDPRFRPVFTPKQMLELGVFEGKYLNSTRHEYPASWFRRAKLSDVPDASVNLFAVKSRQPLSVWQENGWIHKQDPWGWFQWYCRYYMGRRTDDDERQIKRWLAFVRHSRQVEIANTGDPTARSRQRQALLQWSYDPLPDIRTKRGESVYEKVQRILCPN